MAEQIELVVGTLQQRIGDLVSNYETNIAILRSELTMLKEELDTLKEQNTKE